MDQLSAILSDYMNEKLVDYYVNAINQDNSTIIDSDLPYEEIADKINELDNFGSTYGYASLKIDKLDFVQDDGRTRYLRLDVLPQDKSYNHIMGNYEDGISVFALDNNGVPVIDNLQLVEDLTGRADLIATIVTGDRIGTGFDGEPLIANAKYIRKASIDIESIATAALDNGFADKEIIYKDNDLLGIYWDNDKQQDYYTYNGTKYTNPINGFDVRMGKERLH